MQIYHEMSHSDYPFLAPLAISLAMYIANPFITAMVHDVPLHHVPKCMSYHKVIVVITEMAHCFHDCMYVYIYIYI